MGMQTLSLALVLLSTSAIGAPSRDVTAAFTSFCNSSDANGRRIASEPGISCSTENRFRSVEEIEKSIEALRAELKKEKKALKKAKKSPPEAKPAPSPIAGGFAPIAGSYPIDQVIGGSFTNGQVDSYVVRAGVIPDVASIGTTTLGVPATGGKITSSGPFGTLTLDVVSKGVGKGDGTFSIVLSEQVKSYLKTACTYGGQPFCAEPTQQVSVTGVSLDVGLYNGKAYGNVYLYLNGTQHGYTLTFSL